MPLITPDLPDLVPLALAAALAGLMRGFSGFGAALLFVPLASLYVEPSRAVILLFVIDGLLALPGPASCSMESSSSPP